MTLLSFSPEVFVFPSVVQKRKNTKISLEFLFGCETLSAILKEASPERLSSVELLVMYMNMPPQAPERLKGYRI
jgi:hypothetical protein